MHRWTSTSHPCPTLLASLAAQDFAHRPPVLREDVRVRAVLPGGVVAPAGPDHVATTFARWFGAPPDDRIHHTALVAAGFSRESDDG